MNKAIVAGVIVVVVAVAGIGFYLMQNINPIVKGLIEDVGSDVTNTAVRVEAVDISLTEGTGSISGLTIANPEGFSDADVFSMNNISVRIDTGTLTEDVIVINSIGIDGAHVLTEHVGGGTNVQALRNGMDTAPPEAAGDTGEGTSEARFAVERMTFTNGGLTVKSDQLGESSVSLPDFTVSNLGTREEGLTAAELGSAIANSLIGQVSSAVVRVIADLGREEAMNKVKERAAEGLNKLKGLFSRDEEEEAETEE